MDFGNSARVYTGEAHSWYTDRAKATVVGVCLSLVIVTERDVVA